MKKIDRILSYLDELYPAPECALNFSNPYELLVAVILSAQCTDKRVNQVTPKLFAFANTPQKMLDLGIDKLKEIIHPCGFYNTKSKAIMETSADLVKKYNGVVPSSMEELTKLKGVGRKTANVVIGEFFKGQAIAVDTHVLRVSNRLGLVKTENPLKCEMQLNKIFNKKDWATLHLQMVLFGRYICKSQKPACENCPFFEICVSDKKHK